MPPKPNLDILRALSVTLVVADHTLLSKGIERWGKWYVGDAGLFGVYLFFLHTCLVLMWSLERRPNTLDFYVRRIFRIYPLAIVTVLIAAVTHAPVAGVSDDYFHAAAISWKSVLFNCALIQDLLNYAPIHGVTWSLPPELYMYLALPCLFFYARAIRRIWPFLLLWALSVAIASRYLPTWQANNFPILIPDFLAGIVAYVGFMDRRPKLPSWVLLPLLAILFTLYMNHRHVRTDWFVCLAVGLALPSIRQLTLELPKRIAHQIARYSYGIYLCHPFSIVIGMHLLARRALAIQLAALFASLALFSFFSYHVIERPMMGLGAKLAASFARERVSPTGESLENLDPAP